MATPDDDSPRQDEGDDRRANPFAGTPLESLFGALGSGQLPDLSQLMKQMQSLMSPSTGSVNWELATSVARNTVAQHPDPSPTATEKSQVTDAVGLAQHWLDDVTDLPAEPGTPLAWSRAEWVAATRPSWQQLVEPIAEHVVRAMGEAMPAEAQAMAGPLIGLLGQAGGAMFGHQVGQALGELATEVLGSTDVGFPLASGHRAALLPTNVHAFGEGLGQSTSDVLLYLALRESAHQRLFANVPWLRAHVVGAVEEFGRGTTIDVSKIEAGLSQLDPTDPEAVRDALSGGMFEPERTPAQQAALSRLETALALVEGWVDEVVTQATRERMPSAAALREAVRRRRAAGGPAEQTFASLVGLELRPRRLRDASNMWAALRDAQGAGARDRVWRHPDIMPTTADLDDPLGFAAKDHSAAATVGGDFDDALQRLLAADEGGAEGSGGAPPKPEA
ncbi:MAG: zinc-dependent metalloprotease [Nocardioidaceae bacterium]|nr:zinc-dependent metalloprotease [Nocardioidaceae bacterium]